MASSCCSVGCSCAWFRWTPLLRKPSSYTSEVVARDATSVQILAMSAFLLAFSLLQLTKQPWRSKIANLMDGGLVQMMVLLLLCVVREVRFRQRISFHFVSVIRVTET
mmetsp:Transcript_70738/g.229831  ORF Transcript_70738/g.229831 Transcript_70738/m.229831 type:complete len:108 (+) Transcript_70738:876-1199(+)